MQLTNDLSNPAANNFPSSEAKGSWQTQLISGDGRYVGAATTAVPNAISLATVGKVANLRGSSYLEIGGRFNTNATGGLVFDYYGPDDFKFVTISPTTSQVLIGHFRRSTWSIDAAVTRTLVSGRDYNLNVSLKGTTVSVSLDGQPVLANVFNSVTVDGRFGLLSRGGSSSFTELRMKTDDPTV